MEQLVVRPAELHLSEDAWRFAGNWVGVALDAERHAAMLTENWPDLAELKRCQRHIDAAWVAAVINLVAWCAR